MTARMLKAYWWFGGGGGGGGGGWYNMSVGETLFFWRGRVALCGLDR